MPSCLDTYRDTVETAHDEFETALGTCTTIECKRNAVAVYSAKVEAAYQQFLACQGNPGGPVTDHYTGFLNALTVWKDSPQDESDVSTFTESTDELLEDLVEA